MGTAVSSSSGLCSAGCNGMPDVIWFMNNISAYLRHHLRDNDANLIYLYGYNGFGRGRDFELLDTISIVMSR